MSLPDSHRDISSIVEANTVKKNNTGLDYPQDVRHCITDVCRPTRHIVIITCAPNIPLIGLPNYEKNLGFFDGEFVSIDCEGGEVNSLRLYSIIR
jgi:hypothetical protein